ncbi:MAG: pre-rRNA-processing protein esf1, partial [Paramarteilia canceri]
EPLYEKFADNPKYIDAPEKSTKTKVDKRFLDVLTNDDYAISKIVDIRGHGSSLEIKENMNQFYRPDKDSDNFSNSESKTESEVSSIEVESDNVSESECIYTLNTNYFER